jgi:hypothetical protein
MFHKFVFFLKNILHEHFTIKKLHPIWQNTTPCGWVESTPVSYLGPSKFKCSDLSLETGYPDQVVLCFPQSIKQRPQYMKLGYKCFPPHSCQFITPNYISQPTNEHKSDKKTINKSLCHFIPNFPLQKILKNILKCLINVPNLLFLLLGLGEAIVVSHDSVVCTVTMARTIQGSKPSKRWVLSSPKCPDQLLGPPSLPFNRYWDTFVGVTQAGHEVDHSPPFSAKVKNEWSHNLYSPCMPSQCGQDILYLFVSKTIQKDINYFH